MPSRIFSVGLEIPGDAAESVSFRSDRSLFDADVIIFQPTFSDYYVREHYMGKPVISEKDSSIIVPDCAHWKAEIETAMNAGKVIFVFLAKPNEVYYDTGERTYSGTGRSRVATRQLSEANSYDSLPVKLEGMVPREGREISILKDLGPLAMYWHEFGTSSIYEVYFDPAGIEAILGTKKREKVVGGVIRNKSGGALVLLPPLNWDEDSLTFTRGKSTYWRKEALTLGKRFVSALVRTSEALHREAWRTPPPEWAITPEYSIPAERRLLDMITELDNEVLALAEKRKEIEARADEAAQFRALLYDTGRPLEQAIIKTLRLFGFEAEPFREGDSEFDAVFTAHEGRFLGEVEGKDTKAINIDKISQLERNLHEDFERDEVMEYAKGVLFGNAHRLEPLGQRETFFTEKCMSAAKRLKVALVRTPDLFVPSVYLAENQDLDYATACRNAIFEADGEIVNFPPIP